MSNTILQVEKGMLLQDTQDGFVFRVLFVDREKDAVSVIRVDSIAGMPYWLQLAPFEEDFNNGLYKVDSALERQYSAPVLNKLTERQLEKIEKYWAIIRPFVKDVPNCYCSEDRQVFLKEMTRKYGLSDSTARRMLHSYWAEGESKLSLAPRYDKRGRRPTIKMRG